MAIYVDNYSKMYTYVQIDENKYSVIDKADLPEGECTAGVGGEGEDGKLYALYLKEDKVYFQVEKEVYLIEPSDFSYSNKYIDKETRLFQLESEGKNICTTKYKPFVAPGVFYYDIQEDEFDVLLHMREYLESREKLEKFKAGVSLCIERYSNLSEK